MKVLLFLLGLLAFSLHAQEFPQKGPLEITVLFPAGTSADVTARMLADGIISLLESPELSSRMGANGRERAEEFTFERLAQNLSAVYTSAMVR